ncbi:hypothetical protein [Curtobacterium flaccumfaciens]|uniref:hypothetical protein n=1 Tax=Curtobacterium flaccumfaciens TaxID=2035 RepID=UPI001BDE560E|nr:hypothetical protein [Curtobacterium flaccumfaciens]MBT1597667.1 hypothetical protein [Curtobacterium flaccumfaciens pv. flaccumfaciens]
MKGLARCEEPVSRIAFVAEVDQDDGLTLRDIAVVLGVSYQRVHQLVHEDERALAAS